MNSDVLIEVESLSRDYGERRAVRGISFTVRRGEVHGFLGPNGAGKSTTLRMLSGCLAPSSGSVAIAGHDLRAEPHAAKAALGYLPELPPLYPDLSVADYLGYCASLRGLRGAARRDAVARASRDCGLDDVGRRRIGNLSKGFRQRVGIAQAIVHDPDVVLLDEPTVGLDPNQIRDIRALIARLGRERAVILSTHLLPEVQAVCGHVQLLHKGRLRYSGSLAELDDAASTALRCRFARPPGDGVLAAIAGVTRVERSGAGCWRIDHLPTQSPAEALAQAAVDGDWGLLEMTPERRSLESLFVALTTSGPTA